jgi:hypothetical protein
MSHNKEYRESYPTQSKQTFHSRRAFEEDMLIIGDIAAMAPFWSDIVEPKNEINCCAPFDLLRRP